MTTLNFTSSSTFEQKPANTVKILSPNIIKQGDRANSLRVQLLRGDAPVDLTAAAVLWSAASSIGKLITDRPAMVYTNGEVVLEFSDEDAGAVGELLVELKIVDADGKTEKFPANDFARFTITRSLDDLLHTPVMFASLSYFNAQVEAAALSAATAVTNSMDAKTTAETVRSEFDQIVADGPVASVNGKTGLITGLAEQAEVDSLTTALADKAEQADLLLKAEKTYVDTNISTLNTKINSQASGSPKGTYATVAALQTAFPSGNTNVYVVTADGKWYYWNGSAWVAGSIYQSTGIADKSVGIEKLDASLNSALELTYVNLFGTTVKGNINSDTGALSSISDGRVATDFIPINGTKALYSNWLDLVVPSSISSGGQKYVFYDANKVFISTLTATKSEVSPPANAAFVRQNLASDGGTPFSVSVSSYKIWQEYKTKLSKIDDNILDIYTLDKTLDMGYTNLFEGSTFFGVVDSNTGALTDTNNLTRIATDFIPIDGTKALHSNWLDLVVPSTFTQQGFSFYDSNKVFISSAFSLSDKAIPPTNAAYVRQNLRSGSHTIFSVDLASYNIYQEDKRVSKKILSLERSVETLEELTSSITETIQADIKKSGSIYVYDFVEFQLSDTQIIKNCLSFASILKSRVIIFDRKDWRLDEAILLPSNTTVVIDNCMVKQNNNVFDNVFRGNNIVIDNANPNGYPLSVSVIDNIKILGLGAAKIEGCDTNVTKTHPTLGNQVAVGDYWGWRTLQISLSKCDTFEIAGIEFTKTRCWAVSFDKCSNFKVHDLKITSNVKNGDGVDIRFGCHDFEVYNIEGSTSDDSVAMSNLGNIVAGNYVYPMEPSAFEFIGLTGSHLNIYDGYIDNVSTTGSHHGVICLANGGRKVYDISINRIKESVASNRESVVKLYAGYGTGYTAGDIHSIRVNDVLSKGATYAVQTVSAVVDDVWFNKIVQEKVGGEVSKIANVNGVTITNA